MVGIVNADGTFDNISLPADHPIDVYWVPPGFVQGTGSGQDYWTIRPGSVIASSRIRMHSEAERVATWFTVMQDETR